MSALLPIDEILFSVSPGETRAALVAQGRLVELLVERAGAASLVGNVYLGRVGKLMPGMAAAFVELGSARAGFLAEDDARSPLDRQGEPLGGSAGARPLNEGQAVLVQVTKDAFGQKSPRLSTALALAGHRLVMARARPGVAVSRRIADTGERARLETALGPHVEAGESVILRTAAEGVEEAVLLEELAALRRLWQDVLARAKDARAPALLHAEPEPIQRILRDHAGPGLRRVFCDSREALARAAAFIARHGDGGAVEAVLHQGPEPLFRRHDVDDQIAEALEPVAALPSGGSLAIGTLEALTAIDVNTARQASGGRFEDAVLAVNLEAAAEVAHQVRLRNLAGLIVIDFVHMNEAHNRARVAQALRAAFACDPVSVQLGGFTALGLYELTRKRVRDSLSAALAEPCEACGGAGQLKSAVTVAYELLRAAARAADEAPGRPISARAAEAVVEALAGEAKAAREALETRLGRALILRVEPSFGREAFEIVAE